MSIKPIRSSLACWMVGVCWGMAVYELSDRFEGWSYALLMVAVWLGAIVVVIRSKSFGACSPVEGLARMSRFAHRVDANQCEVVAALLKAGCSVLIVSDSKLAGFDLVVVFGSAVRLVEVKDGNKSPSRRALTATEEEARRKCPDVYVVVSSIDEALAMVEDMKGLYDLFARPGTELRELLDE